MGREGGRGARLLILCVLAPRTDAPSLPLPPATATHALALPPLPPHAPPPPCTPYCLTHTCKCPPHPPTPAPPAPRRYNPIKTIKTSFIGTMNMLGLAKRCHARFLISSTSEVYGDPLQHPQVGAGRGGGGALGGVCWALGGRCWAGGWCGGEGACIERGMGRTPPVRRRRQGGRGMVPLLRATSRRCTTLHAAPTHTPQTEEYWGNVNPIGERSCYDEGKRAAECLAMDYVREHGLEVRALHACWEMCVGGRGLCVCGSTGWRCGGGGGAVALLLGVMGVGVGGGARWGGDGGRWLCMWVCEGRVAFVGVTSGRGGAAALAVVRRPPCQPAATDPPAHWHCPPVHARRCASCASSTPTAPAWRWTTAGSCPTLWPRWGGRVGG